MSRQCTSAHKLCYSARISFPASTCFPQEEKVAEVERELNEAQHRVEGAKAGYETIVRRMAAELARFQRERASELAGVLRGFAMAQVHSPAPMDSKKY